MSVPAPSDTAQKLMTLLEGFCPHCVIPLQRDPIHIDFAECSRCWGSWQVSGEVNLEDGTMSCVWMRSEA